MKWIFAEDKEISQGIKHKATMKISGRGVSLVGISQMSLLGSQNIQTFQQQSLADHWLSVSWELCSRRSRLLPDGLRWGLCPERRRILLPQADLLL